MPLPLILYMMIMPVCSNLSMPNFDGRVDVLVNNAGVLINKPFTQLLETDFVEMLQSNYIGHVRIIQSLLQFMGEGSHI
jgi:NAD(P)-dependent dehydrogenase (short-subunit alcohol dehydrogenase family)